MVICCLCNFCRERKGGLLDLQMVAVRMVVTFLVLLTVLAQDHGLAQPFLLHQPFRVCRAQDHFAQAQQHHALQSVLAWWEVMWEGMRRRQRWGKERRSTAILQCFVKQMITQQGRSWLSCTEICTTHADHGQWPPHVQVCVLQVVKACQQRTDSGRKWRLTVFGRESPLLAEPLGDLQRPWILQSFPLWGFKDGWQME